ncbi:MAG: general secretion pathway protein GspB [Candidatus Omnitrophica bacterium]|nr:general secretion pathway protein GspB [Candidatus Omnitrophota bacterium]
MSIIYEALKKTQAQTHFIPKPAVRRRRLPAAAVLILPVAAIVAAGIFLKIKRQPRNDEMILARTEQAQSIEEAPAAEQADAGPAISGQREQDPASLPPPAPEFNLSGILYSEDEKWAIVNGLTLHEEDTVEGRKILEIHPDEVVLEYGGEITIVKYNK